MPIQRLTSIATCSFLMTFLGACSEKGDGQDAADGGLDGPADADGGTDGDSGSGDQGSGGEEDDGTDDGSDVDDGDEWVDGVNVAVHEEVNTVLVVTWTQVMQAEEVWLQFSFESGNVMTSRPQPGDIGAHRDVVLGVPGDTLVTIRIISRSGGLDHRTSEYQGMTESVPEGFPTATVVAYNQKLASPDRWMFGSVEDSSCDESRCQYYQNTFWVYIMDRQGRVVWYYADPSSNISSAFQRVARDGEYIVIDKGRLNNTSVVLMTLDWEYHQEIEIPVRDCIDVTDDGMILHDNEGTLLETDPSTEQTREIWDCQGTISGTCYSNTVNWNPLDDTVLMSFPYSNTVVEIDRQSGDTVGVYGDLGDYDFSPSSLGFEFNHFPTITPDGTLLVSSHMPGYETENPVAGQHAFMEFEIDQQNQVLTSIWLYQDGPEWPRAKGMALRLPNGNTLANYGTGGVIREITPSKETVFHVKFDVTPEEGADEEDFFNKMVNHNVLVDDLYGLNGGPG